MDSSSSGGNNNNGRNECGTSGGGNDQRQQQQRQQQQQQLAAAAAASHFQTPSAYPFAYTADYHGYSAAMFAAAPIGQHQLGRHHLPPHPHYSSQTGGDQQQQSSLDYMVALAPSAAAAAAAATAGGHGGLQSAQSCSLVQFQHQRGVESMDLLRVLPTFPPCSRISSSEKMEEDGGSSDESQPGGGGNNVGGGGKLLNRAEGGGGVIKKGQSAMSASRQMAAAATTRHLLGIVPPNNSIPTPLCPSTLNDSGLGSIPSPGLPPINPMNTFCTVPGRLSLLSSTPKYRVSVGEIHRRINPPECLNASVLGGILRRAKSKDGGKSLRDSLKRYGLVLPAGRRKTANVSTLTALVECEASNLARDFHALCENEFPAKQIADYMAFKMMGGPGGGGGEHQRRKQLIGATKTVLAELAELLRQDRSPLCEGNARPILEHSIQQHLTHFSMVTHGFGTPAILAAITALLNWLSEFERNIQQQQNHPTGGGGGGGQSQGGK